MPNSMPSRAGSAALHIEAMQPEDVAAVAAIEAENPAAWTPAQIAAEIKQPTGWQLVARLQPGDAVIGFVIGRLVGDEAEILRVAVATSHRRAGVGSRLLAAALARLEKSGAAVCFLELRASNSAAAGLYTRHGFVKTAVRRGYYKDPLEDACIMKNSLKPENKP